MSRHSNNRDNHRTDYRKVDITGKRYGRLAAIEKVAGTRTQWIFKCDCGNTVTLPISRVLHGQLSCGCLRNEVAMQWGKSHTTHGESKTRLYHKYRAILDRCYYKESSSYSRYGGRGIKVCDEWKNSFAAFRDWAYANGYDPELDGRTEQSIDRIDYDGDYCPENCRWVNQREQMENRRCTRMYPYHNEMYTASSFADKFGIYDKTYVYRKVKEQGFTLEETLNQWNMIHHTPDGYIKISEYAKQCNTTVSCVNRWIKNGKIQGVRAGKFWYVHIP